MRAGLDYKIKNRLENTVYIFVAGDSLKYTDYVNRDIVQIKAKIEISPNNVLTIKTGSGTKQAKVLELGTDRMILEPISTNPGTGKLVFERVK
jgi:hypothetical protein